MSCTVIERMQKRPLIFFCILRAKRGCCGVIVVGKGNVASIGSVATPDKNACWGVPQTPKKRGETMTNRTRKIVLRVPVTPAERELIRQKMALLHTRNFSAYARKMLMPLFPLASCFCRMAVYSARMSSKSSPCGAISKLFAYCTGSTLRFKNESCTWMEAST